VPCILKVGQRAPNFSLPAYPSGSVKLSDLRGKKKVLLAFYPKDASKYCSKEMCAFSDDLSKFQQADTEVLGISCDSIDSHQRFATKFNLRETLLTDTNALVARAYGVEAEGGPMAERVLFLIDKKGIVRRIYKGMPDNAELLKLVDDQTPSQPPS
jgi:peroxiredoxin Q/BCP